MTILSCRSRALVVAEVALLALVACGSGFRKQRLEQYEDCKRNCEPYRIAYWGAVGGSEPCLCEGFIRDER